jgi:hypothetical protein
VILPLLGCLACTQPAQDTSTALVYSGRDARLEVAIPRVEDAVRIDGVLDEAPWELAARLVDFSTYAPMDGALSTEPTEVLVFYSATAIYFGIRAHAPPGTVRATLANRDQLDTEDQIRIFLSTFNDARQAFYFAVNPLGVQADGVLVEGTAVHATGAYQGLTTGRDEPDLSPDFVFESKGRLTPTGYEVEIRIPFKTLRFPSGDRQAWGIHITRLQQWNGHEDSWVPAKRAAASFLAQGGTLNGLTGLKRGLVLDLTPEVTETVNGTSAANAWRYDPSRPSLGANVRWGVTSTLTMNGTVNPDFSQTEADVPQIQYDPRTALFFPEKRTFFLDGLEQFATPNQLIYTRRIVDPIGAAKLFGKIGDTSVAFISAADGQDQSAAGDAYPRYNLLRVQRDVFGQSKAGLVITDKRDSPDSNVVVAGDARIAWGEIWNLAGQVGVSRTVAAGQVLNGPLLQAGLERNGRTYGFSFNATSLGQDFRADSGFIARPRVTKMILDQRWTLYRPEASRLASVSADVITSALWNTPDFSAGRGPIERKLNFSNNAVFRDGWRAGATIAIQRFDFDPTLYRDYGLLAANGSVLPFTGMPYIHNLNWVLTASSPRYSGFSASIQRAWGRDENFFEWSPANIDDIELLVDYRPTTRLRVEQRFLRQFFQRRSDGTTVGVLNIPRTKVEYQLTRATFLRAIGEYVVDRQDDLRDDGRTELPIVIRNATTGVYERALGFQKKRLSLNFLFSYTPVPGTVFFAGYGNLLDIDNTPGAGVHRENDGFFLKLSYLFRM